MIFVTGDTHGSEFNRLSSLNFPINSQLTKSDYVIICGDFGIYDDNTSRYWLKWLSNKNFTTLFVDGNHENHDYLDKFPVSQFHKAKVHKISDSVYHILRGEVIEIDGYTFFAFGGARSHDISDGILQKTKGWKSRYINALRDDKMVRVEGYDWWDRELQTSSERQNAFENLRRVNNNVHYIITHECAYSSLKFVSPFIEHDICVDFLEEVKRLVSFKHWYFGHHHINIDINSQETCLYQEIRRIV